MCILPIDIHIKLVYNIGTELRKGALQMKRTQHSKVMTIANKLVKQGYNRANAMVKAWVLVKLPNICTKVAGVTYGKRQQAIEHLTYYRPEHIRISLYRDKANAYDRNAVAVIATVKGKGSYTMGYLPKALAAFIAPLMDAGRTITSRLASIKGTNEPYLNYGLGIEVRI